MGTPKSDTPWGSFFSRALTAPVENRIGRCSPTLKNEALGMSSQASKPVVTYEKAVTSGAPEC